MATPVLATKLFIPPPRPQAVPRPRLIERVHEGFRSGRKLTLISAPAGFGKTTLFSQWIAYSQRRVPQVRVAWLSLDEGDNDPSRFLTYLVAALQSVDPGIGSEAQTLHTLQPLSVELTLTALINDVARASHEIVLVLDDFHLIDAAPIRDALTFLLDHLPSTLHLAIAGRSDPPLPLARLRARGELTELRAADLRFTPDEAAAFLNQVMDLGLSAEDITALEARTEGWIAGLQLAALSMRERLDIAGFIEAFTGSHRFVIDYLIEEVLQRQPDRVRSFLMRTAILDRLNGPLCDAVTGQLGGGEMLEALERDNLFIVPLDDRRQWYRYHHLFADVLRARLSTEGPDRISILHRRASEWYERNDSPEDAIRHALTAADFERAASLVERALPAMRRNRQDATLLGWLKLLPYEIAARRPVLSVYYAWSLLVSGDLDAAELRLRDAEQGLAATTGAGERQHASAAETDGEEFRMLPVTIAVYRAALAQARGDVAGTAEHARRALDLTQPGDDLGRGAAARFLGLASWAGGDVETALRTFSEAMTSLHSAGNLADELSGTIVLADTLMAAGRLHDARRSYEQALRSAIAQDEPVPPAMAGLHVGLGELLLGQGDPDAAAHHLQTSESLGGPASQPENRYRWFVAMALIRQAEGNPDAAIALLADAERLYVRGFYPEVRPIAAMRARVRIAQGRLGDVVDWARERGLSAADDLSYLREFEHLTLTRLLIAQYRSHQDETCIREATGLLDRLLEAAEAAGRTGSVNEILVLQALARNAQGRMPEALVPLRRALAQAEPEGYIRLFADEGAPMAALLDEVARQGTETDYVRRLRSVWGAAERHTSVSQPLAEPLSERELQVLRLLRIERAGDRPRPVVAEHLAHAHQAHLRKARGEQSPGCRPPRRRAGLAVAHRIVTSSITTPGDVPSPFASVDSGHPLGACRGKSRTRSPT